MINSKHVFKKSHMYMALRHVLWQQKLKQNTVCRDDVSTCGKGCTRVDTISK